MPRRTGKEGLHARVRQGEALRQKHERARRKAQERTDQMQIIERLVQKKTRGIEVCGVFFEEEGHEYYRNGNVCVYKSSNGWTCRIKAGGFTDMMCIEPTAEEAVCEAMRAVRLASEVFGL